jgi:hypothetical protein
VFVDAGFRSPAPALPLLDHSTRDDAVDGWRGGLP